MFSLSTVNFDCLLPYDLFMSWPIHLHATDNSKYDQLSFKFRTMTKWEVLPAMIRPSETYLNDKTLHF